MTMAPLRFPRASPSFLPLPLPPLAHRAALSLLRARLSSSCLYSIAHISRLSSSCLYSVMRDERAFFMRERSIFIYLVFRRLYLSIFRRLFFFFKHMYCSRRAGHEKIRIKSRTAPPCACPGRAALRRACLLRACPEPLSLLRACPHHEAPLNPYLPISRISLPNLSSRIAFLPFSAPAPNRISV